MKALFLGSDAYERDADGKRDETEATDCTIFGLTFHCGQPLSFSVGVSKMPRSGGLHWRIRLGMLG